jgi:uncharacterized protein (DUF362 family)
VIKDTDRSHLENNVEKLLDTLGGMSAFVKRNSRVLIKPNVLCGLKAETGATVCPEIIETLVRLCFNAGATEVYIAEASNWGIDSMRALTFCGFDALAKRTGARLIDLKKERLINKNIDNPIHDSINLPQILFDVDAVINVPVLKTHNQAIVSVSLKNLAVGVCSDEEKKKRIHSIGLFQPPSEELKMRGTLLDYMIADVSEVLPCSLAVVDGFFGMDGWGSPIKGTPPGAGLLIAGKNRVAVDAVASSLIGVLPEKVPHIVLAHEKGLGEMDLEKIRVSGVQLEDARTPFKSSVMTDFSSILPKNMEVLCENACYSCISNFGYFLLQNNEHLKDIGPVIVFIGRQKKYELPEDRRHVLYYGNCAGEDMYGGSFVPGCVPRSRRQVFEALGIGNRYESYEWSDD